MFKKYLRSPLGPIHKPTIVVIYDNLPAHIASDVLLVSFHSAFNKGHFQIRATTSARKAAISFYHSITQQNPNVGLHCVQSNFYDCLLREKIFTANTRIFLGSPRFPVVTPISSVQRTEPSVPGRRAKYVGIIVPSYKSRSSGA